MIPAKQTFAEYFVQFFGERTHCHYELFPDPEPDDPARHLTIEDLYAQAQVTNEPLKRYTHSCWCNPELVYADDKQGNEVWLHKRIQ